MGIMARETIGNLEVWPVRLVSLLLAVSLVLLIESTLTFN